MEKNGNGIGKVLLIYKSKTGFTKKYAEWIGEKVVCDLVSYEDREKISLGDYDTIIFGGGFYAGTISGLKWFKSQKKELADKNVIIYATGSAPAGTPQTEQTFQQSFTEEERKRFRLFYLQGGINYEKMGGLNRMMMAMFLKMLKKKEGEESEAYRLISQSFDCTAKEKLQPLLQWIEEL